MKKQTLIKFQLKKIFTALKWVQYFIINAVYLVIIPSLKKRFLHKSWDEMYPTFKKFGQLGLNTFGIESHLVNPHEVNLNDQYIIAANHRSWFDQIAIMGLYPTNVHFLAKKEYFDLPFFKYCLNNYEVVPVHKKTLIKGSSKQLNQYIERGDNTVFFIEGTRGSGRKLLPFRKGAFKQAACKEIPILPMYILGSEQCLCKKNTLFSVKKGNIVVIIGQPVYFNTEDLDEQISKFETRYREVHDSLYVDYDKFIEQSSSKGLRPVLGFGQV